MANADLAEPRVFLRKAFSHTVAAALIYCIGSLPNGAAGEGRRGEERVRMRTRMRIRMEQEGHRRGL